MTESEENKKMKHVNEWVIIYPKEHNRSFAGKVVRVEDGEYVLNPYHTPVYKDKRYNWRLVDRDGYIPADGSIVFHTTQEEILDMIERQDYEESIDFNEHEVKRKSLEKQLEDIERDEKSKVGFKKTTD